jgi:hypothetical protein
MNHKKYLPLLTLIIVAALAASALFFHCGTKGTDWMHYFMGFFLCQFAMLKLFRLKNFVDAFQMYDLLASKSRAYSYCYPFIELVLGLCYLAFIIPFLIYIITIVLLGIGVLEEICT